ncbi:MAG TPA: hypothetical protein [Caudoviricetes sp.]|nr:MAG TPA: hypothetical protein [Caudoviricetes sp.]
MIVGESSCEYWSWHYFSSSAVFWSPAAAWRRLFICLFSGGKYV